MSGNCACMKNGPLVAGSPKGQKHPCRDCGFCQWCADSRCAMCRPPAGKDGKKRKKKQDSPLFWSPYPKPRP